MRWWIESGKLCQIPASAVILCGLKGQASPNSLVLKACVSMVNWLGSGPYPTRCVTLPFTNPFWPLKMEASVNTIHCAPFYTRRGQKFSLQVLTVKAELWTCDLLEWVGRGEERGEKRQRGGVIFLQCRMTGFTAACWLHCKHSRIHLIASPWGRNCLTPLLSH